MAGISRREFIGKTGGASAALAFLAANGIKLSANPLGIPIGSQTYPHRARIAAGEFAALLKDMKGIGIEQIELCDPFNYKEFASLADAKTARKMIDDAGMKAISCHVGIGILRKQHKEVLNWAQTIGLTQLSTADLGGTTKDGRSRLSGGWTTVEWIKEAADEYNAIAKVSKAAGFLTVLHNEGFCNSRTADGRLTYPILIEHLDPALVGMQFQMSSMGTVGNPITYFTIYPGRFWSAHMQGVNAAAGMRATMPPALPDKTPPAGRGGRAGGGGGGGLSVGEDTVDWPKVFEAAKIGGMKNFFVEQAWDLTVKSVAYLKTLS